MTSPELRQRELIDRCARQRAELGRHWRVITQQAQRADRFSENLHRTGRWVMACIPWLIRWLFKRR